MKKEVSYKDLYFMAREIVKKKSMNKVMSISDKEERSLLFEYLIRSSLEMKYAEIKEKIKNLEEQKKDMFIILTKLHLLGSSMHFFYATLYKKDFHKIMGLFKEIEKEIKKC